VRSHPGALTLYVVRHGLTQANADGLLLGRADRPLTEVGQAQAAQIAASIGRPAAVVASPLARARETAAAFGVDVEVDDRWIEIDYGDYDCVPLRDVPAEFWMAWRRDPSVRPPGGESLVDLGVRVRAACEDLAARARDEDVVVVTHVSPIKAAVAWALSVGDEVAWRTFVAVASISRIAITERGPALHSFNETHHLAR
jgi:broad specificity phosphatase PhoE